MRSNSRTTSSPGNDRGIALLIVLLVTALLVSLIFEFSYGTRVSLRGAANFRDSQRAYYLARSGVNFVGMLLSDNVKNGKLQDNLEQREWQVVPIISGDDTELRVQWDDEGGKINISTVIKGNEAYVRMGKLFDNRRISQDILDRIADEKKYFRLHTELHQVMGDEDFNKLKDAVTVGPSQKIDVNTASVDVLQSLGMSPGMAGMVVEKRGRELFKKTEEVTAFLGPDNTLIAGMLAVTSDVFKVHSYAAVGGYTKQIEAIIRRGSSGFDILYWRAL